VVATRLIFVLLALTIFFSLEGLAFATGLWWICAIFTTLIMPPLSAIYPAAPYYLFGGCSFVVGIIMCTFPESKDITLEQMEKLFSK
jgi:hypothetical protein